MKNNKLLGVLLLLVIGLNVYTTHAQFDYGFDWYGKKKPGAIDTNLYVLTPNSGGIYWVGNMKPVSTAADTGNVIGPQEIFMPKTWNRMRQNCFVTYVWIYLKKAPSAGDTIQSRLWRAIAPTTQPDSLRWIADFENLAPSMTIGLNVFALVSSVPVLENDIVSVYIHTSDTLLAEPFNTNGFLDSTRTFTTKRTATTINVGLGTASTRFLGIRFGSSIAPVLIFGWDSEMSGFPYSISGADPYGQVPLYDARGTCAYMAGHYLNLTYQTIGIAGFRDSSVTPNVQSTLQANVLDQAPRVVIGLSGTNDIFGESISAVALHNAHEKERTRITAAGGILLRIGILPRNEFTNAMNLTRDSCNTMDSTSDPTHYLDVSLAVRDPNNYHKVLTLFSNDTVHLNWNGKATMTGKIVNWFKTRYLVTDTAKMYIAAHTTFPDSMSKAAMVNRAVTETCLNVNGSDSGTVDIKKGVNGSISSYKLSYIYGSSSISGVNYSGTIPFDTSQYSAGDTVMLRFNGWGYTDSTLAWQSWKVQGVYIPLDSAKYLIDLEDRWGKGKSVYSGGTVNSLYCHGTQYFTVFDDIGNHITDSTAFAKGLYFNGTSTQLRAHAVSVVTANHTIVQRFKIYSTGIFWNLGDNDDPYKIYLRNNPTFCYYNPVTYASTKSFDYDLSADIDNNYMTIIFQSNGGKLYVNGVLKFSDVSYVPANNFTDYITIGAVYGGFFTKMMLTQSVEFNRDFSAGDRAKFN